METYWGSGNKLHVFLNSAVDRGKWRELHSPAALPPGEGDTRNHWTGGWVGHSVGLKAVVKRKNLIAPAGNRTPVV